MNKINIGLLFITAGSLYSLLAWDLFYKFTLGKLVEFDFIKPPSFAPGEKPNISRKAGILAYGFVLIGIGFYLMFLSRM